MPKCWGQNEWAKRNLQKWKYMNSKCDRDNLPEICFSKCSNVQVKG